MHDLNKFQLFQLILIYYLLSQQQGRPILASAKFYSLCVSITIIMLYMQCASAADHHLLYVNLHCSLPHLISEHGANISLFATGKNCICIKHISPTAAAANEQCYTLNKASRRDRQTDADRNTHTLSDRERER